MQRTKEILSQNRESFEYYMNFEDHDVYYIAIEKKITADNCIETCKSLIEGISKSILQRIDLRVDHIRKRFSSQDLTGLETTFDKMKGNGEDFHTLFQRAVLVLNNYHPSCQKELLDSFGKNFCRYLARIRNDRGDIAHGRAAPKTEKSSIQLAHLVENLTDLIISHMLEILSLIDFEKEDKPQIKAMIEASFLEKDSESLGLIEREEQQIRAFNESLDEQYRYAGKVRYSLALYEQYEDDYLTQLQEYITDIEVEAEEN
ncbi:hypothetical protein [Vibrio spartinae]|uniref:Abortive infection protein-like C-terminal domain-containing protein n=1 Tax=Vibrio spartinae TaxID=1918945 RepID=A0A1N6M8S5_9VIBR|nr:hypothetical protein [Vibrio spartinae]SIO95757.1 hypothetical protein VSP9026_03509 [Vibrio spartinae]